MNSKLNHWFHLQLSEDQSSASCSSAPSTSSSGTCSVRRFGNPVNFSHRNWELATTESHSSSRSKSGCWESIHCLLQFKSLKQWLFQAIHSRHLFFTMFDITDFNTALLIFFSVQILARRCWSCEGTLVPCTSAWRNSQQSFMHK